MASAPKRRRLASITPEQWTTFWQDGWVVLKKEEVFSVGQLEVLQKRIDEIMLKIADVPYDKMLFQLDTGKPGQHENNGEHTLGHKGETLGYRKIQNLEHDPDFLSYMKLPIFEDACRRAYDQGQPIRIYRAMFFNKPASQGSHLPWHQDRWPCLDRDPVFSAYTALDASSPANGCVQVVRGSHKRGVINPDNHSGFLTPQQVADIVKDEDVVDLTLEEGDVALIHNLLLHRSGVNSTSTPRRAVSVCYMDGLTAFDPQHHPPDVKGCVQDEHALVFPGTVCG